MLWVHITLKYTPLTLHLILLGIMRLTHTAKLAAIIWSIVLTVYPKKYAFHVKWDAS